MEARAERAAWREAIAHGKATGGMISGHQWEEQCGERFRQHD